MNISQDPYKGKLIIRLPNDDSYGIESNLNKSIVITSNKYSAEELYSIFKKDVYSQIYQIKDTDKKFLKPTCRSGYCDMPVLRFQIITEDVLSLSDFKPFKTPIVVLKPMVSECNDSPCLNKYCEYMDKKLGCMGCVNPFMQMVINTAQKMQNVK